MKEVKVHLTEAQMKALDAQYALVLGAFLEGFCEKAPDPADYGVDSGREAHYRDVLSAQDGEEAA